MGCGLRRWKGKGEELEGRLPDSGRGITHPEEEAALLRDIQGGKLQLRPGGHSEPSECPNGYTRCLREEQSLLVTQAGAAWPPMRDAIEGKLTVRISKFLETRKSEI